MTSPTAAAPERAVRQRRSGGSTLIPRWTLDPGPGVAEGRFNLPADVVSAWQGLAAQLAVPTGTVLLAAHSKVLAALSGRAEVITGYVALVGESPQLVRLTTEPATWLGLILAAHRSELAVHEDEHFPQAEPPGTGPTDEPTYETELDPTGGRDSLAGDTVLRLGVAPVDGRLELRVRYRTDVLDAEAAARIAGYHATALGLIVADPHAKHGRQSLLSADERRFQLEELAGPGRALPDRRVHELFEAMVRARPDAVAAVSGDRRWTYRELNARANRIGRALLARGLEAEGVVAIAAERDLEWLAAVLAVFKAGGAYLPIEPHFPAERMATMLSRAGCRLVLAERGSTETLEQAPGSLAGIDSLLIDEADTEGHADGDLGVDVAPDQLAYIYFTSGSTGEPKGAMCEHEGMLNHLLAKIDDLELGPDVAVAQTAPQCFDISLWQLLSALLVGGRTVIVSQERILDVGRFIDTIVEGRVAVLQLVPTYLDVVAAYLEQHPRALPDLRFVSVTGEALTMELVRRWFAVQPSIRLVNAYGLTETSDDTNHEIIDRVPDGERIPSVGRSATSTSRSSTGTSRSYRSAPRARSSCRASASAAATSTTVNAPQRPSCPIRNGRAGGSTARATSAAGCPTASWSS